MHRVPVDIVLTAVTVVDEDGDAARARARTEVALPFQVIAGLDRTLDVDPALLDKMETLLRSHQYAEAGALIPDDLLDKFTFAGTPEEVAAPRGGRLRRRRRPHRIRLAIRAHARERDRAAGNSRTPHPARRRVRTGRRGCSLIARSASASRDR